MRYSILLPVYNGQAYLAECLDSLVEQTGDFEIIAVDDGSTDQSGQILDAYARDHSRLRVLHTENRGVSQARNSALAEAVGEYICFVDADDRLFPGALAALEPCAGPDLIFFGYTTSADTAAGCGTCTELTGAQRRELIENTIYDLHSCPLRVNSKTVWAKLYRRARLSGIAFPAGVKLGEDKSFNFQAFRACETMVYVDRVLYYNRKHAGSVTARRMEGSFASSEKSFAEFERVIAQVSNAAERERYSALLACRMTPILYNCLYLDWCHRDNPLPFRERRKLFEEALRSPAAARYIKACDPALLQPRDAFTRKLLRRSFRMLDAVMKRRLLRGGLYALYQIFGWV